MKKKEFTLKRAVKYAVVAVASVLLLGEVAMFSDYKVHKTQEIWMQETASIYTTECPFEYHAGVLRL